MAIKRCLTCRGTKTVMGLGALEKKCHVCKGSGREDKVDDEEIDDFLETKTKVKILKKKPGRPRLKVEAA